MCGNAVQAQSDLSGALFGHSESAEDSGQRIAIVEFTDADITDVFKIISDNSGWSIFASRSARLKVSLWAKDITARELLDKAVAAAGLVYHKDKNVINVMTFDEYVEAFGLAKQVVDLQHVSADQVDPIVRPFLTGNGRMTVQQMGNRLILIDAEANLAQVTRLLETLDVPSSLANVEIVRISERDAAELVEQISAYASVSPLAGGTSETAASSERSFPRSGSSAPRIVTAPFAAFADPNTNSILLIGSAKDRQAVRQVIEALDEPGMRTIRTYPVRNIDAQEIYDALEKVFEQAAGRGPSTSNRSRCHVAISRQTNAITVIGSMADQAQADSLVQSMDIPIPEGPGRIRIYRLENTNAQEMAALLAGLTGGENTTADARQARPRLGTAEVMGITSVQPPVPQQVPSPPPPAASPTGPPASQPAAGGGRVAPALQLPPRIAANADTNSVIVWASPADQQAVEQIVSQLDRRRPQVLIEAVLVELTADDDFSLGIELESWQPNTHGDTTTLFFTSFGLSTINPNTGERTLIAQPGVGAAILRPDEVPFVLQALETTGRASIHSYPKILVNDNVPGLISSVREEPYTQINASDTVATTSFGGFVQAGIQFAVVPHISQSNHLRLEYQVQLNSFVGPPSVVSGVTIPPARDTNTVQSEVTVPDNHTIVIGGLQRKRFAEVTRKVPLLGDIPGLGYLFQSLNKTGRTVTLYFFLRPKILRDDRFIDLKMISQYEVDRVDVDAQWPRNPAIVISDLENAVPWQDEVIPVAPGPVSQPAR